MKNVKNKSGLNKRSLYSSRALAISPYGNGVELTALIPTLYLSWDVFELGREEISISSQNYFIIITFWSFFFLIWLFKIYIVTSYSVCLRQSIHITIEFKQWFFLITIIYMFWGESILLTPTETHCALKIGFNYDYLNSFVPFMLYINSLVSTRKRYYYEDRNGRLNCFVGNLFLKIFSK